MIYLIPVKKCFPPPSGEGGSGQQYKECKYSTMKKTAYLLAIFLISCLLLPATISAGQDQEELFLEANTFFHQAGEAGDPDTGRRLYEKALLRYEKLAHTITNGKLYYNIGNTYFMLNDIGRAVINYRRAERLIPGDENLEKNLAYVLEKRQDIIPVRQEDKLLQTLFFWHYDLSTRTKAILFSVTYGLFWLAAGLMFLSRLAVPRWLTGSLFGLVLVLTTSLLTDRFDNREKTGAIVAPEVIARQGDGRNYQPSFTAPLHAGTEFTLIARRADWLQVELDDGRRCWLPEQSCELV